ncbi:MAG: hypothetical protein B0W54_23115 [Cellvibrio sp. 79]|nr:MAG: hypothetical protein B0W54_23115 [Cellvibrio sp. 79]
MIMRVSDKLKFKFGKDLSLILQADPAESGLACLAMLVGYHQGDVDYAQIRHTVDISRRGITIDSMVELGLQLMLEAKIVNVAAENLQDLELPCILQWDFNHFVVLDKIESGKFHIYDPAGEVKYVTLEELSRSYRGAVVEVLPLIDFVNAKDRDKREKTNKYYKAVTNEAAVEEKKNRFSWRRLIGSTSGIKRSLFQITLLALAMEALALLLPLATQLTFDQVIVTADIDLLMLVVLGMAFLELTRVALNTLRAWSVMILSATLNLQWITNVFSHLVRLPIAWFEKRHIGDVTSRFEAVHAIQGMVTTRSIEVGLDGLMSIGALIILFVYNAKLALIVLGSVLLYFFIRLMWYRTQRRATEENVVLSAQQHTLFLETLRSINTIRLFNGAESRKVRWANRLIAERNAGLRMQRQSIIIESCNWTLFGAERIAILALGALSVIDGAWTVGMFLAFYAYAAQFVERSIGVVDKIIEFKMLSIQVERLSEIVLEPAEQEYPSRIDTDSLPATFTVDNICFRYDKKDELILNQCSLDIKQGESIAIVGASGCGKSTLLKLMIGAHEPESGRILYGGMDLSQIGTRAYRELIGVVLQDDQLLSGSIAENIAFFADNPDFEHIKHCAQFAAISKEIEVMPLGYHTLVGDMGTWLSGGQKQRLLLARALYKKPKVLFLDEATSHLDVSNEALVNDAVRRLGITTIVIAHRPETIRMANRIFLVENGSAREIDKSALDELKQKALEVSGVIL